MSNFKNQDGNDVNNKSKHYKEYILFLKVSLIIILSFVVVNIIKIIIQIDIYKLMLVLLVIGTIWLNMLFGIIHYISEIGGYKVKITPLLISNITLILLIILNYFLCNYSGF